MYIKGTPEQIWAVLTDDAKTPLWQHFNLNSRTEWHVGGAIIFLMQGREMIVGKILELEPPKRLVHSFSAQWSPDVASDKASRVTWTLEPVGTGATKLVLTHDDFGGDSLTSRMVVSGWNEALSRLKTLIETGTTFDLPIPQASG
jgi:uncharacterized protein YndB with AHSA1/START domain